MLFVEATPEKELADACKERFKQAGLNVKVVEKSGISMKKALVKSNPFKNNNCERDSCGICETHDINCKTREVVYRISCNGSTADGNLCHGIFYEGETSRSVGERFNEHMKLIESGNETTRKKSFISTAMSETNTTDKLHQCC